MDGLDLFLLSRISVARAGVFFCNQSTPGLSSALELFWSFGVSLQNSVLEFL